MGDDPFIPELKSDAVSRGNGSAATGGSNYAFHYGLSKGQQLFVVVMSCLAFGLSVGAVVMMAWGQQMLSEKITSETRRAMDMASLAEREARIAQDKYTYVQSELAKRGIHISTDGH
jgi:hypothetical protein